MGIPCFRGSSEDVLARYHAAAQAADADMIVRVTGDCPLFDGTLLDEMLAVWTREAMEGSPCDYFSNVIERTYPRGLDCEIFTFAALDTAFREATRSYDREHVTSFLYNNPELFRLRSYTGREDLSQYRWTLDTPEDYALIARIYDILSSEEIDVTTSEVIALMERCPELRLVNSHIQQKKDATGRDTVSYTRP